MVLGIVKYTTLTYGSKNVFRKTDGSEQASIDPFLRPAQVVEGIVDLSRFGAWLLLKWAQRPSMVKWTVT
jgi:hypothetical protein